MAEGQSLSVAPTPRDAKGQLEDSRAGELATYLQENLEAMQLAGDLAQQETHSALELVRRPGRGQARRVPLQGRWHTQPRPLQLREKSQALEVSVAELVRQVKDLSMSASAHPHTGAGGCTDLGLGVLAGFATRQLWDTPQSQSLASL